MADQLPPPPVPADADLTHFDDMPLEVRRLRDSGIAGTADAEAFRCAVLSWCAAWHQVPAGSLPNDDGDLCRLVGLGRDLKTWRRIKANAMRGWRLFADGRLYHPVLTEKVIERWNSSQLHRWAKEADRLRKENKGRADRMEDLLPIPPKPAAIPYQWPADRAGISAGTSAGLPPESRDLPTENRLKGKERKGKEGKGVDIATTPSVTDEPRAPAADPDIPSPEPDLGIPTSPPWDAEPVADTLEPPGFLKQTPPGRAATLPENWLPREDTQRALEKARPDLTPERIVQRTAEFRAHCADTNKHSHNFDAYWFNFVVKTHAERPSSPTALRVERSPAHDGIRAARARRSVLAGS